ncbi:acetyl-CoA carboxylase [Rhizobium sp. AC27/96]|uniref:acetyl-CoA carboxylase n=1 Tax=Rhizobium sp. AC27/96 TaxID=1841653 RepID=UPI000828D8E5|nr:acetyl-CoA carboxylase [Rhizobium sp. AC27/96]OCJ07756.1 acetyl-CoA carboxylase [Rhizobium sp. AC27/96]
MSTLDFSDPSLIAVLTDALTVAGVDGIEISKPAGKLRIVVSKLEGAQVSLTGNTQQNPAGILPLIVKAPMAGHFCPSHPTASDAALHLPRMVSEQDVIGFIRIGSILLPIAAGRAGSLTRHLAEPNALVGFGDPLFEIEPIS